MAGPFCGDPLLAVCAGRACRPRRARRRARAANVGRLVIHAGRAERGRKEGRLVGTTTWRGREGENGVAVLTLNGSGCRGACAERVKVVSCSLEANGCLPVLRGMAVLHTTRLSDWPAKSSFFRLRKLGQVLCPYFY